MMLDSRLSVAPMMDWTDRHCRSFHRILAPHAVLYTEMVTEGAVLFGNRDRLLGFDAGEHPVVLQLGGSDPVKLAEAARIGAEFGYDALNLNCGCPSDRVQAGRFGACLMAEPALVAECVAAMREASGLDVSVKTRIGLDQSEGYDFLLRFIEPIRAAGCHAFIIHARKAWLKGLSPRENREVPPLDYSVPRRLKHEFPELTISVNGGIETLTAAQDHLAWADGVMIGRAAYQQPWFLATLDAAFFGGALPSRHEIVSRYRPYLERRLAEGVRLHAMTRHMLGLFNGERGGRLWRRHLGEMALKPGVGIEVIDRALALVETEEQRQAA
jgi:tRNA-dihydrouridine synthase A